MKKDIIERAHPVELDFSKYPTLYNSWERKEVWEMFVRDATIACHLEGHPKAAYAMELALEHSWYERHNSSQNAFVVIYNYFQDLATLIGD